MQPSLFFYVVATWHMVTMTSCTTSRLLSSSISQVAELNTSHPPGLVLVLVDCPVLVVAGGVVVAVLAVLTQSSTSMLPPGPDTQ